MTLATVGVVILALVIFLFVLEPILRARGEQVVLDASALPRPPENVDDPDVAAMTEEPSDSVEGFTGTGHPSRNASSVSTERSSGSPAPASPASHVDV